jgi:hypothetical protein
MYCCDRIDKTVNKVNHLGVKPRGTRLAFSVDLLKTDTDD